jgi:hypothetical protein
MKHTTLRLSAPLLLLTACGAAFVESGHAQRPQGDQPVEQTRKDSEIEHNVAVEDARPDPPPAPPAAAPK